MKIEIRRPTILDVSELSSFFRIVITDTFVREGIGQLHEDIEKEIYEKETYILRDIETNGKDRYFYIAIHAGKIIGTIEYGPSSKLIIEGTNGAYGDLVEVGTVFVHPEFQKQGIGNLLLNVMYITLKSKGIQECCLDSGYSSSQKVWKKKFGAPDYLFLNYWGPENHHMIWRINLEKSHIHRNVSRWITKSIDISS